MLKRIMIRRDSGICTLCANNNKKNFFFKYFPYYPCIVFNKAQDVHSFSLPYKMLPYKMLKQ